MGATYAGKVNDELVFAHAGFGAGAIPYLPAWDLQRAVHRRRADGEIPDTCLMLEHQPVYTAGKRTEPSDRPIGDAGAPVIDVDRGGRITWHGPGQLVGYPIIKLREPVDVVGYVRSLEDALIRTCADFGVRAGQIDGRSGAWVTGGGRPDRKVGAIGARVARGVTMHGFALNCDCDLDWFSRIVPCGISDAGVTSLSAETGHPVTVAEALPVMEGHLADVLGRGTFTVTEDIEVLASPAPMTAGMSAGLAAGLNAAQ
jgi:lipoyl(octanoyl) transferase